MKSILFVTYGGGHVNMIVPVVNQLMGQQVQVDVLALTTARSVLEKVSIPFFSFQDLPISAKALEYGTKLMIENSGHPLVPYEESVAYMGLSYECLVEEHGEAAAEKLYGQKGRHAFLPVAVMEKLIREKGYDLVVATNSPRAERAAIVAATNLGVPSVCIVDLFATQGVAWLGKPKYADRVCVLSGAVKRRLCQEGRKDYEIVVTGNPAFDRLSDSSIGILGNRLRGEKGWLSKKVILWCSQMEPENHPFTGEKGDPQLPFKIEKELKDICDLHKHEDWHLVVRPHPSENLGLRKQLEGVEYGREDDLATLLKAVDVVVVTSSTVGLEAVLLGVPVVALDMSIFSEDMPFNEMGLALGVDSLKGLNSAIEKVFSGKYLISASLPEVGSAAAKVSREIHVLLGHYGGESV